MKKKILHSTLFLAALLALALPAMAQNGTVIAVVDAAAIISEMPEYKAGQSDLEALRTEIFGQLETRKASIQSYYEETMKKAQEGDLSPIAQKEAEGKLQEMQGELDAAYKEAEKTYAEKEKALLEDIQQKVNRAMQAVAAENNYDYIVEKSVMLVINKGIDATLLVKAKLGIN